MPFTYKFSAKAIAEMFPPEEKHRMCICYNCVQTQLFEGYIRSNPYCFRCFPAVYKRYKGGETIHHRRGKRTDNGRKLLEAAIMEG
jgi:hypothetical protein